MTERISGEGLHALAHWDNNIQNSQKAIVIMVRVPPQALETNQGRILDCTHLYKEELDKNTPFNRDQLEMVS